MSALLRRIRQLPRRAWIVFAVAVIAGAGGLAWLNAQPASVSTDNAYLKADISAGDPLVRLDDTEYAARVRSAEAEVREGDANIAAAKAALDRLAAEQSLAQASVEEARTSIASAEAERARARDDRKRYEALVDKGYVARQRFETAAATATTANANVDKARAASSVAESQAQVTHRRRAELDAALKQAEAQKAKAEATLALARQDLGDTVIRAPVDGVVGDRKIETGEYVQAGSRLMAVVAYANLYVVANFKETQTDRMLPGQKATIDVDALSGDPLQGVVESLAPAAGSEFALLPFEPGTGNFTKIVQRVPVRIKLKPDAALMRLRPGLSVNATVELVPPTAAQLAALR
jgi:membrane fusion protein (multidrug efflux system)